MKHVDAFETTDLPEQLGREFAASGSCVAVLVASDAGDTGEPSVDAAGDYVERPAGRASATAFSVGDGYVVERNDASGNVETLGMRSDQFDAYVERVRGDEAWTVLSVAEGSGGGRRERVGSGSLADR